MRKHETMRGLSVFITDIRNAASKEEEIERVNLEMANIRTKFKGDKAISGYDKKKYVCKLIYIFLLGHDFEFGHMEAVNLLTSVRYSEKCIGYLFISVVMSEKSRLRKLTTISVKTDLASTKAVEQDLALKYIANMADSEIAEVVLDDVFNLVFRTETENFVKQSGLLCLVTLLRIKPDIVAEKINPHRLVEFLADMNLGVVSAAASLVGALAGAGKADGKIFINPVVGRLQRIIKSQGVQDYEYHRVPAPWLVVKMLKLLGHFSSDFDQISRALLIPIADFILGKSYDKPKISSKLAEKVAQHAIMIECILLIHSLEMDQQFFQTSFRLLEWMLKRRESNCRLVALETMTVISDSPEGKAKCKEFYRSVMECLDSETDPCVVRMALDFLYVLCDETNYFEIAGEMLWFIYNGNFFGQEALVIKIAIICEKYCGDTKEYVDLLVKLMAAAQDSVPDSVVNRFVQVVTGCPDDTRSHACASIFDALSASKGMETLVKLACYILGEFGKLVATNPSYTPLKQLRLIHSNTNICSRATQASLLTCYLKFALLYDRFPSVEKNVKLILQNRTLAEDLEIQTRAVEYLALLNMENRDLKQKFQEEMPVWEKMKPPEEALLQKSVKSEIECVQNSVSYSLI